MNNESKSELQVLIRDELVNYIIAELRNGYDLNSIRNVLEKKHHQTVVQDAVKYLKDKDFDLTPLDERKQNVPLKILKANPEFERILKDLKRYIKYKLDEGYSKVEIKDALLRYGHYYDLVEHCLINIENKKIPKDIQKDIERPNILFNLFNNYKYLITKNNIYLFVIALITIFTSIITQSPLFVVIYGFLPVYLLNFILRYKKNKVYSRDILLYVVMVGMFYAINYVYIPFGMNINSIMIYNFVFIVIHFLVCEVQILQRDKNQKVNKVKKAVDIKKDK